GRAGGGGWGGGRRVGGPVGGQQLSVVPRLRRAGFGQWMTFGRSYVFGVELIGRTGWKTKRVGARAEEAIAGDRVGEQVELLFEIHRRIVQIVSGVLSNKPQTHVSLRHRSRLGHDLVGEPQRRARRKQAFDIPARTGERSKRDRAVLRNCCKRASDRG